MLDLRNEEGIEVCVCGSTVWVLTWVMFHEGVISAYSDTMKCELCGSLATPPMPKE